MTDTISKAREFFARHEFDEFYRAVAYSGYRHATDKQHEIMAAFADERSASLERKLVVARLALEYYADPHSSHSTNIAVKALKAMEDK
jgi:hypothetical protein